MQTTQSFTCPLCKRTIPGTPSRSRNAVLNGQALCLECSKGKSLRDRAAKVALAVLAVAALAIWSVVWTFVDINVIDLPGPSLLCTFEMSLRDGAECMVTMGP